MHCLYQPHFTSMIILNRLQKLFLYNNDVREWSKAALKKEIKERIKEYIEKVFEIKKGNMKKLRFINTVEKWKYVTRLRWEDSTIIMKARLNMLELKTNSQSKYEDTVWELCHEE